MNADYLNRMGITTWQLRHVVKPDAFFQVQLKNAAGKIVGVMFAEINLSISVQSQEQLLCKIAEAMTAHYDYDHCKSPNFSDEQYQFILFLGKKVLCDAKKIEQVIYANTLSELIRYPEMKKVLWLEIKKLRDLFNE